ncbi:hypothetical protein XccvBFoX7_gp60c [Xanthomonas phage FoX7]|uniref:Uncharacterized protein n=2 Tax=Carpasinavirus XcP1 TaxID=2182344 RepID=A0A858NQ00_9CAUD|nr:hypothetical protein XccvBFoX6_gp60c [Xanthomonas phage FoX6]QJB22217.1 hypothetical protein XccvBFoX7_gp60c [Xanthomonas phage FoX7]
MSNKDAPFNEFIAEMRKLDPHFAPRKSINKLRAAFTAGIKHAEKTANAQAILDNSEHQEAQAPCHHNWKRVPSEDGAFDAVYSCTKCGEES